MMKKQFLLSGMCVAAFCGASVCAGPFAQQLDFEKTPARTWQAADGAAALSELCRKSGDRSLLWRWTRPAAALTVTGKEFAVRENRNDGSCFGMWIYLEKPLPGTLRVEFLHRGKPVGETSFFLNFRHWRPLGARYARLNIKPGTKIDAVRLIAPAGAASGRLWIDDLALELFSAGPKTDYQQPGKEARAAFSSHDWSQGRAWLPPLKPETAMTPREKQDLAAATRHGRTVFYFNKKEPQIPWTTLKEMLKKYRLSKQGDFINGRPLESGGTYLPVADALDFRTSLLVDLGKLTTAWENDRANRKEIEAAYIDLCCYFLAQGFQEGNNNMGGLVDSYVLRHWPSQVFRMYEVLRRAGIADEMAAAVGWYMGGSEMVLEKPVTNTDFLLNLTCHIPSAYAMLSDPAERYQRFAAFKRFLDQVILSETPFGADGTIHHHWGHHLAYGGYSPPMMFKTQLVPFADTAFRISPEAQERLRQYVRAVAFQSAEGVLLPNLFLRAGAVISCSPAEAALQLAKLGAPGENTKPDREMAGIYLDAAPGAKGGDAAAFAAAGIRPIHPQGHMTLNMAAIGVHRRGDRLVAAAGMNLAFRGLEIYGWLENNNYGRYARNGSVIPATGKEFGFREAGWDWNFWPGASSVIRPAHELFEGYAMYPNSYTRTAGGVNDGNNGVWGMDYQGFDLQFRKSAFCFGDRVTVVTSDIRKRNPRPRNSPGGNVVTCLFQQHLATAATPIDVDGTTVTALPYERTITAPGGDLLGDTLGNAYYLWPDSSPVKVVRRRQSWTYLFKRYLKDAKDNPCRNIRNVDFREKPLQNNEKYYTPTEGDFTLAWFDHGAAPKDAACVYTLLLKPAADASVQAFDRAMKGSKPPLRLLQKNGRAHVLYDAESGTYGYAVFDPSGALPGPLSKVDAPCFVMVAERDGKKIVDYAITDRKLEGGRKLTFAGSTQPATIEARFPGIVRAIF